MVSILIPVYNNYQYLYDAIDSICMQDYFNIQVIISDDGSSVFPEEEIRRYIDKKNTGNIIEYTILTTNENVGTVKNMNKALMCADGDIIVPLAADDVFFDKNVISNYVKAFKEKGSMYDVIITQIGHYDKKLKNLLYYMMKDRHIALVEEGNQAKLYEELCKECFLPAVGSAYKSDIFLKEGKFDEKYVLVEDWPFYFKLVRHNVRFYYGGFTSVKHRDGGTSHSTKDRFSPVQIVYRTDIYNVIKNEILPNYENYAPQIDKRIITDVKNKIVLHEFIYYLRDLSIINKIIWFKKNIRIFFALYCVLQKRIVRILFHREI